MLYWCWGWRLKEGQSSLSIDETMRRARGDRTNRTALHEGRYIWGDQTVYGDVSSRFDKEVVKDTALVFIAEKLAEREQRHKRMGDSRYVVEPNVKEGKGGLRDLDRKSTRLNSSH